VQAVNQSIARGGGGGDDRRPFGMEEALGALRALNEGNQVM
jgi:hypothetical protein